MSYTNKYFHMHSTNNKKFNKKINDDDDEEDGRDKKLIDEVEEERLRDSMMTDRNISLEEKVPLVNRHRHHQQQQQQQQQNEIEQQKIDNTSFIKSSNEMNNPNTSKTPSQVVSLTFTKANTDNANQLNLRPRADSIIEDHRYKVKLLKKQRKHDIQKRFNDLHINNKPNANNTAKINSNLKSTEREHFSRSLNCHMTFIFDPNGRLSYWMSFIVSLAFLYNFWVMIYRFSFNEINAKNKFYWFIFDYFADFLYACDIIFNFRTGYLEEGVLQTDPMRLRHHYMNTTRFYVDCLCLMPLDILYLSIGYYSIFRCFRLVKVYKFWIFLDRTERHTNFPNLFRTFVMLHYLFAIFHWNACLSYFLARFLTPDFMQTHLTSSNMLSALNHNEKLKVDDTDDTSNDILRDYLKAFYLSTKIMTLVSDFPNPRSSGDYLFAIFQLISALLLFATIMGHVGYIVSNLGNARKEFQSKLDAVKTYMMLRRVPDQLQDRVIRWFDFLWTNHKSIDDNHVLNLLPYKLRAEIAIHVHLDTLKRVEIFQNTEAGFLNELVLKLKPVLFSPGDYICRKGEVGKEMYIVNGGKLHVISDNGKIVLATLKAGSYFGEISVLNMGASGNRRTASVRSVGYSDLFCLAKEDLWEVLKEYPAVRVKLEAIAIKRLENHKKPMSETVNLKRCKSAPSLMEPSLLLRSQDLKDMKRHGTLPSSLLKRTDISMIIRKDSQSKSGKNSAVLPSSSKSTLTLTRIDETRNKQSKDEIAKSNRMNDNDLQISIPKFDLNMSESKLREKAKNEKYNLENETLQKYEQAHLIKEIKRLRRRIVKLEAENSQLSNIDLSKRGKETSIGSSANSSRSKNNSERMLAKEESDTDEFKV